MEKSSFFNSVNGDRKYKASDFAEFFNSLVTNGVFPNPSTNLEVVSNSNLTVTIKPGKAWISGYVYINDSDLILPIDAADGVLNRIDRIVLRMDTDGRAINAIVKKGTFASSPVALALQRDADGYELGIADVYIAAGSTSIAQSNITDLRMNTELCGWVNSLIQADTTAIFNQYQDWFNKKTVDYNNAMTNWTQDQQSAFNTWFNNLKSLLDSNAAGNLENQITAHISDNTKHVPYAVTTNTGSAYSVTIPNLATLSDGLEIRVKFNVASNGTITLNVNSIGDKKVIDSFGNQVTNIRQNLIANLAYENTSDSFTLLGKGGGGTATASDIAAGKTATTDQGLITGTMPVLPPEFIGQKINLFKTIPYFDGTRSFAASVDCSVIYNGYGKHVYKYDITDGIVTDLGCAASTTSVNQVLCNDDGTKIFYIGESGNCYIWVNSSWASLNIQGVRFACNNDGSELYVADNNTTIYKVNTITGDKTLIKSNIIQYTNAGAPFEWQDDNTIICGGGNGSITILKVSIADGTILRNIPNFADSAAFAIPRNSNLDYMLCYTSYNSYNNMTGIFKILKDSNNTNVIVNWDNLDGSIGISKNGKYLLYGKFIANCDYAVHLTDVSSSSEVAKYAPYRLEGSFKCVSNEGSKLVASAIPNDVEVEVGVYLISSAIYK